MSFGAFFDAPALMGWPQSAAQNLTLTFVDLCRPSR